MTTDTSTPGQISPKQFRESEGVEDWRVLGDGANAYFRTGSYAAGARLVQAISELPGTDDLLPDVDVRHDGVTVRMVAFIEGYGGMLRGHVELARKISAAARKLPHCGPLGGPEPPRHSGCDRSARSDAVLARRARVRASPRQPRRGSRGSAWSLGAVLVRADEGGAPGRRRRDPHRGVGALRAGRGAHRGSARRGRPDGARHVRAVMVDACRSCGQ